MRISLGEIHRVAGWALPLKGKVYCGICTGGTGSDVEAGQVLIAGKAVRMLIEAVRALREIQPKHKALKGIDP